MKTKRKMKRKKRGIFAFYIPLVFFTVFVMAPFVWTFITSLKNNNEMFKMPFRYLPENPSFKNYVELMQTTEFLFNMKNSFIASFSTVLIAGVISVMAGYAFSRYRFKGRNALLAGFLMLYLVPQTLLLMPLYVIFKQIGIIHTVLSLIVAYSTYAIPYSVWLTTSFINQVPRELEEAAMIDGCNLPRCIIQIVLPLVKPGIIASCSFIFITCWNEYAYAVLFTDKTSRTVTVALASFMSQFNIRWDMITAGGIIIVIPVVIMFMFMQRDLVAGLTAGGVKG